MDDQLSAPSTIPPSQHPKTYQVTACSISYRKPAVLVFNPCTASPPSYILRDISFTARPSEILAIVGPSGAGKSTLLDILAAHTSPSHGSLLLNSSPLQPSSFRKLAAYVPQHDASLPLLTVFETFLFTARLLLPTNADLTTVITSLLGDLRLSHLATTRLDRDLSGGERRRVSIGLSLLHDPAVLLLDEPTSGLDSASAFNLMQTLRAIAAARRRTVILSIHQPSFKILSTIDRILLLSKGTVVHHGTLSSLQTFLHSNGFQVPPQLNALEYALEILGQISEKKSSTITPEFQDPPSSSFPNDRQDDQTVEVRYRSSRVREIIALYNRFWKIIYRSKQLLLTNALEALAVGIFLGTIYIHVGLDKQGMEKRLGLFAFTLTFLLSSTTETLPIFVSERPILLRETSSGLYRLSSHLIANTLVFLPYLLVIALIYSVSVYFLVGLCASWQAFAYFVLAIWVIILMANSFVLFLSSIAPNFIAGTSLVTVFLACFFLFSGYFISKDAMPKYWVLMHYFSMYKYALDALLINEYSCLLSECLIWYEEKKVCAITGRDVLEKRGLHESQRWSKVQIMLGFFVLYRVLCLLVLTRRASRSKK
ncbi:ABC transporter G family member 8 [Aristolochia californica]|uniref:ABC transporter G family member 8 n=1 Tax=Aristolochia californica TaxID=171875 RepID=UPI0035DB32B5